MLGLVLCSLLVEEIDVGEGKVRQVVSGLAKFCSPDDLAVIVMHCCISPVMF